MPVSAVETEKLAIATNTKSNALTSKEAKTQVIKARKVQEVRFKKEKGLYTNSQMKNAHVKKYGFLTPESENLLRLAAEKFDFSARSYFRLIKVSRTIADLANSKDILPVHMAEALQYRQMYEV